MIMVLIIKERNLNKILLNRNGFSRKLLLLRLCMALSVIFIFCYTYTLSNQQGLNSSTEKRWQLNQVLKNVFSNMFHQTNSFNKNEGAPVILLWTPYFSETNWLPSLKDLSCPIDNCNITSDRLRLNQSSAVILHWRNINSEDLPVCKSASHYTTNSCPLLILFNKEAPPNTFAGTIEEINDKIHWTVTYRRDSDVIAPYGKVAMQDNTIPMPSINLNRTSVCWLVSNCETTSHREQYVKELKHFIPVEVYGKCGNGSCPHEDKLECYKWLSNHCRFYLSFENSICKDYSTEKLYLAMMTGMVPIVLGGDDYARYLPAKSFINVKNFSSPNKLAEYLQELIDDDSKYLTYFQWRRKYIVQDTAYKWICDICSNLHKTELSSVKPHNDITEWWFGGSECSSSP